MSVNRVERRAMTLHLAVLVVLTGVVALSAHLLERQPLYPIAPLHFPGSGLLEGWVRYDGNWYRDIATNGYRYGGVGTQSNVAYFPGYPLAMRAVMVLVGSDALSGYLITVAAGLGGVVAFARWLRTRVDRRTAHLGVALLVTYPFAWFLFGAVYADALFFLGAVGAFLLLESDHPILAGVVGALASASRPVGAALVIGLVLVTIQRRGGFRRLRRADYGVLISAAGFAGWSAYQWARWGNPLLFSDIEGAPGWDQGAGPRTWLKVTFLQRVHHLPGWLGDAARGTTTHSAHPWLDSTYTASLLLQAACALAALLLLRIVWRRFGWGYAGYVAAILAVTVIGTKDFLGVGRYLLAAFPVFGAAALVLTDRPKLRVATLVTFATLLVVLTSGYARGYYLA